jgi:hypothetical protein
MEFGVQCVVPWVLSAECDVWIVVSGVLSA